MEFGNFGVWSGEKSFWVSSAAVLCSYLSCRHGLKFNKHHLSLDVSAYTLLIRGLCRADKADWAYLLFDEMVGQEITPRYQTCRLMLDEVRQKNMYDAAERIEDFMKKL